MDMLWSDMKIDGIEFEEQEISREDFERLFSGAKTPPAASPTDDTVN